MKKSNSRCKKLPFSRISQFLPVIISSFIICCTVDYSFNFVKDPDENIHDYSNAALSQSTPPISNPAITRLKLSSDGLPLMTLAFNRNKCQESPLALRAEIGSQSGRHLMRLKIERGSTHPNMIVDINNLSYRTKAPDSFIAYFKKQCNQWMGSKNALINQQGQEQIKSLVQAALPACNLTWSNKQIWSCQNPSNKNLSQSKATILTQKKMILKKWPRQPYILSRRISLTQNLNSALSSDSHTSIPNKIKVLCNITKSSQAKELPLIMRSVSWHNICTSPKENLQQRMDLLHFVLDKAVQETQFLLNISKSMTYKGQLQVKFPYQKIPSKDFWITLEAQESVGEKLLQAAMSLNSSERSKNEAITESMGTPLCWVPGFFDADPKLFAIASIMNLTSKQGQVCQTKSIESRLETKLAIQRYLVSSLVGETEFILSNGRRKILCLPEGSYQYKIFTLPSDSQRWSPDQSKSLTRGEISWSKRHTRRKISAL